MVYIQCFQVILTNTVGLFFSVPFGVFFRATHFFALLSVRFFSNLIITILKAAPDRLSPLKSMKSSLVRQNCLVRLFFIHLFTLVVILLSGLPALPPAQ